MSDEDIRKLISMVKTMPESQKLLKNLILDYLALKDLNKSLVSSNLGLLEDIKQYELVIEESGTKEIIIN